MSTIKDLQQELDDKYLIEQFEQGIKDGGGSADKDVIFNNPAAMFFLAELQYKKNNAGSIMNMPSHVCKPRSGCMMINKTVTIYRKVCWNGGSFANKEVDPDKNVFAKVFGAEANPANYQVCFGDHECEHARLGHYCEYASEQGVGCHHREHYDNSNIKQLKDFWVCQDTGNVHACGSMCQQQKIMSIHENDYVCSLTGSVTSRNIVNDTGMARQGLLGENGAGTPMGMPNSVFEDTRNYRTTIKDKGNSHKRKRYDAEGNTIQSGKGQGVTKEQFEKSMKWWEDETEMAGNKMIVDYVVEQLFFSKKRQMFEADLYLNGYKEAFEEVSKYMRTKKQVEQQKETDQHTINTIMALSIFQYRIPTSMYFKNVPMMPSVRKYILNGIGKLDASFITNNGVDTAFCDDDSGGMDFTPVNVFIEKVMRRKQKEALSIADDNDSDTEDEADNDIDLDEMAEQEERKMLEKWNRKATIVKRLFAVATISIWRNINKNLHELQQYENMIKFKKFLIPLLYMLRKQFIITENINTNMEKGVEKVYMPFANVDSYTEMHFSESFSKANKLCVVVIPKVEFASLLPNENQLYKFNLVTEIISENYMKSEILAAFGYASFDIDEEPKKRKVGFVTPDTQSMSSKGSRSRTTVSGTSEKPKITVAAGGILIMRKITKMHTDIKKIIKYIASCGRLASMQLRMEDISQRIINKTDDMFL